MKLVPVQQSIATFSEEYSNAFSELRSRVKVSEFTRNGIRKFRHLRKNLIIDDRSTDT